MRRFISYGLVMFFTFAFGFGVDRLSHYRRGHEVARVAQVPPAEQNVIPVPITSAMPDAPTRAESGASLNPTLILDYDRKQIVRYGMFFIYGRKPREFADFDAIELDLAGAEWPYGGYISINTFSAPYSYDSAMATFAFVTERRLFFVTTPTHELGVEYWFDGEFLTRDLYSMYGKHKAALRGTLTKTKNGRKIAERVISFRVEHFGC